MISRQLLLQLAGWLARSAARQASASQLIQRWPPGTPAGAVPCRAVHIALACQHACLLACLDCGCIRHVVHHPLAELPPNCSLHRKRPSVVAQRQLGPNEQRRVAEAALPHSRLDSGVQLDSAMAAKLGQRCSCTAGSVAGLEGLGKVCLRQLSARYEHLWARYAAGSREQAAP